MTMTTTMAITIVIMTITTDKLRQWGRVTYTPS